MQQDPVFSIIMASYKARTPIEGALASIVGQSASSFELIVQDNDSQDGTKEFIQSFNNPSIHVCSEQDSGVYNAWNKALMRAHGTWCLFLGADDRLFSPHVLARAVRYLKKVPESCMFAQAALAIGRHGKIKDYINRSRGEIFRHFVSGMPLLTPALFIRREIFAKSLFDTSYRIAGDFAFVARFLTPQNLACLPFVLSYMELGGLSSSLRHADCLLFERRRVLAEVVSPRASQVVAYCSETLADNAAPLEESSPLPKELIL